jgi:hypothetical protein
MTLTTDELQAPETLSPAPSRPPAFPTRVVLGWVAVIAGLTAAAVLAVLVLTSDSTPPRIDTGRTVAEHGSITAIDHRDQLALARQAASRTVAEHGSVAAIDYRDQLARQAASRTVAEHGSITAIDHRDQLAVRREAATRTVAEHGSVRAVEAGD